MTNVEIYTRVTADLVAALEAGTVPWARPLRYVAGIPQNAVTRRPYSGINVFITICAAERAGYTSPGWLTFKQAEAEGLTVRRGERSTHVVFMNRMTRTKINPQIYEEDSYFLARWYSLFNLDQLTGDADALARLRQRVLPLADHDPLAEAEAIVMASGARIAHNITYQPSYDRQQDSIFMPTRGQFPSAGAYYGTLFHELAHWTGAPSRLGRDLGARFADADYAAEELVAELTAAYLCHALGLDVISRSAPYLASWLACLRAHPTFLVASASAASRAASFLRPASERAEEAA